MQMNCQAERSVLGCNSRRQNRTQCLSERWQQGGAATPPYQKADKKRSSMKLRNPKSDFLNKIKTSKPPPGLESSRHPQNPTSHI